MISIHGDIMRVRFDTFGPEQYATFLKCKRLPESNIILHKEDLTYTVEAPARYAALLGVQLDTSGAQDLPFPGHLFDDQTHVLGIALAAKRYALWAGCGWGKGFTPQTPVLTPHGWKPIGNLNVGDLVFGADGLPHPVRGVYPRGIQNLYRISFSDGVFIVCDGDHLWNVRNPTDIAQERPWRTLSTLQLLASNLHYGVHGQSRTWKIPLVAPVQFPHRPVITPPYVLGVLLGDGSLRHGTQWSKPDKQIADRVAASLPSGVEVRRRTSDDRCDVWSIRAKHRQENTILDDMRRMGLMGLYSHERFVPSDYLFNSVDNRLALLQGLLDTDGYAGASGAGSSPEFCSTSRKLADAVVFLVQSLGGTARLSVKPEPTYSHAGEQRVGRAAWRVHFTLPPGIEPFSLPRKTNTYAPASRGLGRWIDSIEPVPCGESVCIQIDAPDGLFVTEHCIVTHNTLFSLEFARQVSHRTEGGRVLITTMNEIVPQWIAEARKFYGDDLPLLRLESRDQMREWARHGDGKHLLAVTNYEKWNPEDLDHQIVPEIKYLSGIILDENRLKTGGGKQKWAIIKSCKGLEYKLTCTATPAPNDLMEFASQASFLEKMRSEGEIIWTYFRRDEKTHRWTVKPHARQAFFEFMAAWSIYIDDPRRYGWRKDVPRPPDPVTITHDIAPTPEQQQAMRIGSVDATGQLSLLPEPGSRNFVVAGRLSQVAKGFRYLKDEKGAYERVPSHKPGFVADLAVSEVRAGHQVIIWTIYDAESDLIAEALAERGQAFSVLTGSTKRRDRPRIIEDFKEGWCPILMTRGNMLGWGMNLQCCSSMIHSGYDFSFERHYQEVRRAYRHGQTKSVRIHIPVVRGLEDDSLLALDRKSEEYIRGIREMEDCYLRAMGVKGQ